MRARLSSGRQIMVRNMAELRIGSCNQGSPTCDPLDIPSGESFTVPFTSSCPQFFGVFVPPDSGGRGTPSSLPPQAVTWLRTAAWQWSIYPGGANVGTHPKEDPKMVGEVNPFCTLSPMRSHVVSCSCLSVGTAASAEHLQARLVTDTTASLGPHHKEDLEHVGEVDQL